MAFKFTFLFELLKLSYIVYISFKYLIRGHSSLNKQNVNPVTCYFGKLSSWESDMLAEVMCMLQRKKQFSDSI